MFSLKLKHFSKQDGAGCCKRVPPENPQPVWVLLMCPLCLHRCQIFIWSCICWGCQQGSGGQWHHDPSQSLLIWVPPVFLCLHLPSFLSLWTLLVQRLRGCLILGWLLFQGCTSQYSKHSALSGAADGCWKQSQQAPSFSWEKPDIVIVKDFQLLQALQVTFPRHKWDYSVFVFIE